MTFGAMSDPRRRTSKWALGAGLSAARLAMSAPSLLVGGALVITRAVRR